MSLLLTYLAFASEQVSPSVIIENAEAARAKLKYSLVDEWLYVDTGAWLIIFDTLTYDEIRRFSWPREPYLWAPGENGLFVVDISGLHYKIFDETTPSMHIASSKTVPHGSITSLAQGYGGCYLGFRNGRVEFLSNNLNTVHSWDLNIPPLSPVGDDVGPVAQIVQGVDGWVYATTPDIGRMILHVFDPQSPDVQFRIHLGLTTPKISIDASGNILNFSPREILIFRPDGRVVRARGKQLKIKFTDILQDLACDHLHEQIAFFTRNPTTWRVTLHVLRAVQRD